MSNENEVETEMKKRTFIVSFDELYWVAQCREIAGKNRGRVSFGIRSVLHIRAYPNSTRQPANKQDERLRAKEKWA